MTASLGVDNIIIVCHDSPAAAAVAPASNATRTADNMNGCMRGGRLVHFIS